MTKRKLPRRFLDRHRCKDCGLNVIKAGEYYMVNSAIWEKQLGLTWSDNLCIGCLESRLGRKLKGLGDFGTLPKNPGGYENSERYQRRLMGEKRFAISKLVKTLRPGDPLPKGWKWKKDRGRWCATDGHMGIASRRVDRP